uniref:MIP18 family-like domain-containing protein n=1 Tax=Panagrolaimus sp. JU765 TaxID=591449 RepID=A0AC34QI85_9BILA
MSRQRLDNVAPVVFEVKSRDHRDRPADFDENVEDPIDAREIFDYIRDINDPEHPYTLEQLNVVQEDLIKVYNDDPNNPWADVRFTPTIPHCSMATLIGLSIRVKLMRSLPPNMKAVVRITEGTHNSETAINKQLADKERVAAAIENASVMQTVNNCLRSRD